MSTAKLNKSALVKRVQERTSSKNRAVVSELLNVIFEEIGTALVQGEQVDLPGFGAFTRKLRSERQGRNPQTGEALLIPAKWSPVFKPGKDLRDRVAHCPAGISNSREQS